MVVVTDVAVAGGDSREGGRWGLGGEGRASTRGAVRRSKLVGGVTSAEVLKIGQRGGWLWWWG